MTSCAETFEQLGVDAALLRRDGFVVLHDVPGAPPLDGGGGGQRAIGEAPVVPQASSGVLAPWIDAGLVRGLRRRRVAPGDSIPLHREWSFVRETWTRRSWLLWMPIESVEGHEGQIQIVPRSHRLPTGPRCPGGAVSSFGGIDVEQHVVTIPLSAGSGVVIDAAAMWRTLRNNSEKAVDYLVAALTEPDVELVHGRLVTADVAALAPVTSEQLVALLSGRVAVDLADQLRADHLVDLAPRRGEAALARAVLATDRRWLAARLRRLSRVGDSQQRAPEPAVVSSVLDVAADSGAAATPVSTDHGMSHAEPLRVAIPAGPPVSPASALDFAELDTAGYAYVDLLDASATEAVLRTLASVDLPTDAGFFASPAHAYGPVARGIHDALLPLVEPRLAQLLPDHRIFMIAVTSKGPESDQPIMFHQDWTYTDEREVRAVFLWVPLVDVDVHRGGLQVVPGSHRWSSGLRPSRGLGVPEITEEFQPELQRRAINFPMVAGSALVFDPATIHGSGPNRSSAPRPVITIALAPKGADLLHFHQTPGGPVTGYRVDEAFFTEHAYATRPEGYGPAEVWADAIASAEFARVVRPTRPGRD